jgi:hypothetical protein
MSAYIKKDDAYKLALKYGRLSMASIVDDLQSIEIVRCGECEYTCREDDHEIWCTGRGSPCQLVARDGFCDRGKARAQK